MQHGRALLTRLRAGALAIAGLAAIPACYVDWDDDPDHVAIADHLSVQTPRWVCVGDRFEVGVVHYREGRSFDRTADAVFATSNPDLLVIERNLALARAAGIARITALVDGRSATKSVFIEPCGDAGAPADASPGDGGTDALPSDGSSADGAPADTAASEDGSEDAAPSDVAVDADDPDADADAADLDDAGDPSGDSDAGDPSGDSDAGDPSEDPDAASSE